MQSNFAAWIMDIFMQERVDALQVQRSAPQKSATPRARTLDCLSAQEIDFLANIVKKMTSLVKNNEIKVAHERCE